VGQLRPGLYSATRHYSQPAAGVKPPPRCTIVAPIITAEARPGSRIPAVCLEGCSESGCHFAWG